MGNARSNVTGGVKAQAGGLTRKVYQLADLKGGGILVELTKQATTTKNYAALDEAIKQKVEPFLYNKGDGKLIHVSRLVLMRNKERGYQPIFKNEAELLAYQEPDDKDKPWMYRDVCWDLDERGFISLNLDNIYSIFNQLRSDFKAFELTFTSIWYFEYFLGAVGESCLHLCLLNATSVHAELAKRLLRFYPKLINDVYMSDEYYGENVLHMAIVNEDPGMVKYLLEANVNYQERCTGCFMSPEDQKPSRTDVLEHEWVRTSPQTNYDGYVYWGEYPASFAACLGQEECYRLILAKGADPDAQDSNLNTVLHLQVIHNNISAFNMAYELGANSHVKNRLNLTPLTLAAKIARKDLFFHIMNIERDIYWQIGSVTCAAYPLTQIDTIDTVTGGIQKESALNLIVFGESVGHLELMEGPVIDLLHAKWNTFVKFRFYRQFITFVIYFFISLTAFLLRPIHRMGENPLQKFQTAASLLESSSNVINLSLNLSNNMGSSSSGILDLGRGGNFSNFSRSFNISESTTDTDYADLPEAQALISLSELFGQNGSDFSWWGDINGSLYDILGKNETRSIGQCFSKLDSPLEIVKTTSEILVILGSIAFLLGALREWNFLGSSLFFENLSTAPARVLFLISCFLVHIMVILRIFCLQQAEDIIGVIVMLTTSPFFLFFCRGFKTVGPFVVMIYRMLQSDLLRFVIIYLVFVIGFSQAFYVLFISFNSPGAGNPLETPAESIIAMFMMSLSNFETPFKAMELTEHENVAKGLFIVYMGIVAILLINMLIAMMGNTYTKIAETKNEWQRQWARIVLVVERGVSPGERLARQLLYSQPMSDGTRALVLRLNQSQDEKEEMKDLLDLKRYHFRAIARRQKKLEEAQGIIHRPSVTPSLLKQNLGSKSKPNTHK